MRIRRNFISFMIAGVIACGGFSAPALAASSHSTCGTSTSSSSSTYGGQGTQIGQVACPSATAPPSEPTATSSLPFTGLDIGLLVAAGAVLVAAGMVLRWRLRHEGK